MFVCLMEKRSSHSLVFNQLIHPYIFSSYTCTCIYPAQHPSIHFIHPSIYSSIHPSIHPFIHPSIHCSYFQYLGISDFYNVHQSWSSQYPFTLLSILVIIHIFIINLIQCTPDGVSSFLCTLVIYVEAAVFCLNLPYVTVHEGTQLHEHNNICMCILYMYK